MSKKKKKTSVSNIILWILIGGALAVIFGFVLFVGGKMYKTSRYLARKYEDEIRAAAAEYKLDPNLVFAIVRTESGYDPNAVSPVGAKGLMQVMPATAEWVSMKKRTAYDESRVFDVEYNLDLGCYLLAFLLDRYDGNIEFAAAAYNAGHGSVDGWLNSSEYYDGEKLTIPYDETRNYVKKVMDAYERYTEQEKEGK